MDKQTFDSLPLSIQNNVIDVYKKALMANGGELNADVLNIEKVFGKDNLTFLPRTWDELVEKRKHAKSSVQIDDGGKATIHCEMAHTMAVCVHCVAAIKIAQLMEKSYGGKVDFGNRIGYRNYGLYVIIPTTDEEEAFIWEESSSQGFIVKKAGLKSDYTMLAFKTQALAENFLKYNYDLVRNFYNA